MASLFQIRRGQSLTGSLQSGELYYDITSQSLALGSDGIGNIQLAKIGQTNNGDFDITGNLIVSGNTTIIGNLQFGSTSSIDTVTLLSEVSSSIIPFLDNTFDLGYSSSLNNKNWKTAYITSITGSLSGSVDGINVTQFSASVSQSIGTLNNTAAQYGNRIDNLEQHSSSVNNFTASITASYNATSESLNLVSQSLLDVSASYIATSQSFDIVSASLLTFSASQYNADSTSFDNRLDLVEATASVLTIFSASISTSVGLLQEFSSSEYKTDSASFDNRLDAVESYTASLKNVFEVSGSGVGSLFTLYGDLKVEGTQSIIHSENLAVKDNLIYLNDSSSITNPDLGIVGNYNDGTYAHAGIYRDSIGGAWRVFEGLTDEPSGSINSGHASFQLADFEANEVSASINGIGRVGAYSASVNNRVSNLEATASNVVSRVSSIENYTASVSTSVGLLQEFSGSEYKNDSSSFDSRLDEVEFTASYLNTTFSTSVDSRLDEVEFTASYLNTTFSSSVSSRITSLEETTQSLNTYTASVSTSVGLLQEFSGSEYKNDSSSFNTRISSSTLTFNDTTAQTGIDFTHIGTQVSAIASGLSTTSNVTFNDITASGFISSSRTIYCDTLVANTLTTSGSAVNTFTSNGTYGSVIIKDVNPKSIKSLDNANFDDSTFSITGSFKVSGSISGSTLSVGDIIANDITASGNLFVSGTIYAYELHTVIQSSSVIFTSGSNQIGDQLSDVLTITGSLYQTGSTSFSELSGSLFDFSSSLNSRFNNNSIDVSILSSSIYQTDATQSNNILINSQSAWGAFQSASAYSASAASALNELSSSLAGNSTLSASVYQVNATQSLNIEINSASAWGAFQSASAYSSSLASRLNTIQSTYATTGSNTFNGNQIISGSLNVTGDVVAYSTSDERLKDNIQLISNPIQKVNELRGVEFDWKDGMPKAGKHEYGVIAQDVLKVMPELVNQRQDGYYAVDYEKMIGLLIEVVKEQEKRIKDLENKIGS